ncbi:hypothetical protein [Staphylococcus gallinarum]|uniref:hypothetical protein n=1 Tax=Staphylococcus gallinarum TaxID=1293 RepID=UPI000D1E0D95|nr:hypothetical protein [Staphylococcus gallinarum]PTK87383.1 hypothetical protein BUZ05_14340 [Staphylococcus gallinarum]PTK88627.1 hypothetical protein BUZ13_12910 [Staphylococcus gallinarum]RIO85895.1 hypothetical protein BUZ06_13985 [Staphylococcus gallinarum]
MSNKEDNRTITIGMKHSGKEFSIDESDMDSEQFEKFMDNLADSIAGEIGGITIVDNNNDFLYLSFDSVAYFTIT